MPQEIRNNFPNRYSAKSFCKEIINYGLLGKPAALFFGGQDLKHTVIIKSRPVRTGKHSAPDGAICGNGDVGVILGEHDNGLSCFISKADF